MYEEVLRYREMGARAFRAGLPCDPKKALAESDAWRYRNPGWNGNCLKNAWTYGWQAAQKAQQRKGVTK